MLCVGFHAFTLTCIGFALVFIGQRGLSLVCISFHFRIGPHWLASTPRAALILSGFLGPGSGSDPGSRIPARVRVQVPGLCPGQDPSQPPVPGLATRPGTAFVLIGFWITLATAYVFALRSTLAA